MQVKVGAEGSIFLGCPPWSFLACWWKAMSAIHDLRKTIARLRAPGGCPWDIEQTHQSLTRCLIDECSELLDTIDRLDMPHMREELGDVLIQVVFHAQLAEESGHFDLEDVAREVNEKLIRRHPHVFGESQCKDTEQVLTQWEKIKAAEKKAAGKSEPKVFKDLPPRLPALMYAETVWKQIEKKKLPSDGLVNRAEVERLAAELDDAKLGRLLFEIAAACRAKGLDPEAALRRETLRVSQEIEKRVTEPTV